ncbi:MAG: hypothetical protein RR284_07420 [Ruthenibacterium sp.]
MIKAFDVCASDIQILEEQYHNGLNFRLYGVSDVDSPENNSVIFVKKKINESLFADIKEVVIVAPISITMSNAFLSAHVVVIAEKNKNLFANILYEILDCNNKLKIQANKELKQKSHITEIGKTSAIHSTSQIGMNVVIGEHCEIGANVIINDNVVIGDNVVIKENCIIGNADADVYFDNNGYCRTVPHLAGVIIETGCLILAKATISAGDTRPTTISKNCLISIGAIIAHNTIIGSKASIGAGTIICGHCNIGAEVYMAPGVFVRNRISIADKTFLGLGCVVTKSIKSEARFFGNPAKKLEFGE